MTHTFAKLIAASSIAMFASFSYAAWDFSISQGNSQLLASTSSFTADDDLRFASQMVSTNQPDANGFALNGFSAASTEADNTDAANAPPMTKAKDFFDADIYFSK